MKRPWNQTMISLLFAVLIGNTGLAQEKTPQVKDSAEVPMPITLPSEENSIATEDPDAWLESALLRYRNLHQQTKGMEADWLEQMEATLARVIARTGTDLGDVAATVSATTTIPPKTVSRTDAVGEQLTSAEPLNDRTVEDSPATEPFSDGPSVVSCDELLRLKDQLEMLSERVGRLERTLAASGIVVQPMDEDCEQKETQL